MIRFASLTVACSWLLGCGAADGKMQTNLAAFLSAVGDETDPSDSRYKYSGRIDFSDSANPVIFYGGSIINVKFKGTSLKAKFSDNSNNDTKVGFIIDGGDLIIKEVDKNASKQEITIATGLSDGTHTLEIIKLEGPGNGNRGLVFHGLVLDEEKGILAGEKPALKIEVFGDSVTEGASAGCAEGDGDCGDNNAYLSFANTLARDLNADIHNNGIAGLAVRSGTGYFESGNTGLDATYDKLSPSSEGGFSRTDWDFGRYTPDLVIMAMGVNDEYGNGLDDVPTWKNAYKAIARDIYEKYGNDKNRPFIFAPAPIWARNADKYAEEVANELKQEGYNTWFYNYSFEAQNGHPDRVESKKMASELKQFIETNNILN
ncbi:GDSL-type esterase/lipase family protein [Lyngbya sp. CCY1209]|uniref:GDSL-type esterase/lipase family protein n=1 Tax=Lyngbya sp. CCY1209 TaxID=2886103 RepID=UPI002D215DEF|nr:GDSL-type esterase/lipase family protein [Lyngbya sp. CCY1209]MEB3886844.1 GDSL-type esterase/lipase family protein [Lyngbya sp. CCY1209]